jgi:multiple sugar transport system substrate-binding protein
VKEQSPDMLGEDVLEPWMLPGSQGNDPVMFLGGTLVSIGGGAQDPERATEFIRHLYEPELLAMTSIDDGQVPAVADLPQDEELLSNRLLTFVNDNLDHAVASEGGSPAWMEIRGNLNGQIEACVTGQQSPADTIAQIKSDAEQAISRI